MSNLQIILVAMGGIAVLAILTLTPVREWTVPRYRPRAGSGDDGGGLPIFWTVPPPQAMGMATDINAPPLRQRFRR